MPPSENARSNRRGCRRPPHLPAHFRGEASHLPSMLETSDNQVRLQRIAARSAHAGQRELRPSIAEACRECPQRSGFIDLLLKVAQLVDVARGLARIELRARSSTPRRRSRPAPFQFDRGHHHSCRPSLRADTGESAVRCATRAFYQAKPPPVLSENSIRAGFGHVPRRRPRGTNKLKRLEDENAVFLRGKTRCSLEKIPCSFA